MRIASSSWTTAGLWQSALTTSCSGRARCTATSHRNSTVQPRGCEAAMRIVIFCHSLASDWNHGNAHFLRGVCSELVARGHDLSVYEPRDAWSAVNLGADAGEPALDGYRSAYPDLQSVRYDPQRLDLDRVLNQADLVLVHEWNPHDLV